MHYGPSWFIAETAIGYFSMEMALEDDVPTYSGGLGVLAGDTLRSAVDLNLPLVGVTLVSRRGYFSQTIDQAGCQHEAPSPWNVEARARPLNAKVALEIEGRQVWVGGWLYPLTGHMGGQRPVILLDTDLEENQPEDRALTDHLYGGDDLYRLKQEVVLGVGGVRLLTALGCTIRQYHMNEGHSALLLLELIRRSALPQALVRPGEPRFDLPRVREQCCFTTHTPVEAGHDRFSYDLVRRVLGDGADVETLKTFAGEGDLNMTRLALSLSEYVNGVAKRHAEVSRGLFPGYAIHSITNGVHPFTWASPPFRALYDAHLPGWCHEPELLTRADCCIDDDAIWAAHRTAKAALADRVHALTGVRLENGPPVLGFARRMTAYKRPELLFTDIERLRDIAAAQPFQVVLAGKAHPQDAPGKRIIESLHRFRRDLDGAVRVVYLPDYDMALARLLVAGVDVWVNTPLKPMEASGTSGMKAALNGVPSLSVLDGWWIEGCIEGVTGWSIGDHGSPGEEDAQSLYDKLEHAVLPLYYGDRRHWISVMKSTISKNASYFNSHRMMRRYVAEAYLC